MTHEAVSKDHDAIIFLCDICPTDASLRSCITLVTNFPVRKSLLPALNQLCTENRGPNMMLGVVLKDSLNQKRISFYFHLI